MSILVQVYGKMLSVAVLLIIMLFPSVTLLVDHAGSASLLLLTLWGLPYIKKGWAQSNTDEKRFVLGILLYFGMVGISFINANDIDEGLYALDKQSRFLLAIPIYFLFREVIGNKSQALTIGMVAAALVLLSTAFIELYPYLDQPHRLKHFRANGGTNAMLFGNLAALVAAMLLPLLFHKMRYPARTFLVFCIAGAFMVTILSGTRSSLLGFIGCLLVLGILCSRLYSKRTVIILLVALSIGVGSLYVGFKDQVDRRIHQAYRDIELYLEGSQKQTSLGQRLWMWEAAINTWQENPIIGSGVGDFEHDLAKLKEEGVIPIVRVHTHAHNIFLEVLATLGTAGFIVFMWAWFIYPAYLFYKRLDENRVPAMMGLMLLTSFAVQGLAQGWTALMQPMNTYALLLVLCLHLTISARQESAVVWGKQGESRQPAYDS